MDFMKILVYTACYKRSQCFKLFLQNMKYIQSFGYDLSVVAIGDAVNKHIFMEEGHDFFILYKNDPLGEKWNAGLQIIKDWDFDYLLISGSDDIYSPGLFERYYKLMSEGVHYVGILDFYFFDLLEGHIKHHRGHQYERKGEPLGAGRLLHRSVLDALKWQLWDDHKQMELDLSMTKRLNTVQGMTRRVINLKAEGLVAMDLKDGQNIHEFRAYKGEFVPKDEILKQVGLMQTA